MENEEKISTNEPLATLGDGNRGHLKIFIGYAPGVGKTYTMLTEGNRRKKYGQDVVIGYVESHDRPETNNQIGSLEIIPLKKVSYNKVEMEEMDTESIIKRNPRVVLIDELAHTNVPGSKNKKRYMDVEEILNHGITVITTLNIQHLESLNDVISQITGIKVKETIPDYIVDKADEIVVVDLTPDALQNRLNRGQIYNQEKTPEALKNFFRKGNLNALRELTLRQIAEEVDEDLAQYMNKEGIRDNWHTAERIMVCISPSPSAKKLIRRGSRIAKRYKCEWFVVTVNCTNRHSKKLSLKDKQVLHTHFQLAKQLGAEVATLEGSSVTEEIVNWCNKKHITQIFMGYPKRTFWELIFRGSTVNKLIRKLNNVDVHLIANEVK